MPTAAHHRTGEALPRPLIAIGVPCAGALLIAFFLIRGFPYDQLGELIANRIEESHGIRIAIGDVRPTMQLAGPALEGTQLRATFQNRPPQQIDRALVRPAWSMTWLTGDPALHVELESPSGKAEGTLYWNGGASWVGSLRDARLELPPLADWIPIAELEGPLDATLDLSMGEAGLEGLIEFEIDDGSITLPGFPVPLAFESITGAVSLGGDAYLKLTSVNFAGSAISGSGSGKIGRAKSLPRSPIGFEFQLDVKPELANLLRGNGVNVNPAGDALVRVSGTVAGPIIR